MARVWISLRLVVPAVWFGMILALSFIETPLKFLAPGITLPIGLGLGRIVFWALAIAGWVLLLVLTIAAIPRPRITRADVIVLAALWVVLGIETFLIRPALSARSDVIIAGGDPGGSSLHYVYIAADLVLLALLLVWSMRMLRRHVRVAE